MLKKHGIDAGHFEENHLANYSRHGQILLQRVKEEIKRLESKTNFNLPGVLLKDFRLDERYFGVDPEYFSTNPLMVLNGDMESKPYSVKGKKVVIVPTCYMSKALLSEPEIQEAEIAGFVDRDTVLQGKNIEGIKVYGYEAIKELKPDVILVASHEQHHQSILKQVSECAGKGTKILVYKPCSSQIEELVV